MLHRRCQRLVPGFVDRLACKGLCNGRCGPEGILVIVRAETPRLGTVFSHEVIAYTYSRPVEIAMISKSCAGGRKLR